MTFDVSQIDHPSIYMPTIVELLLLYIISTHNLVILSERQYILRLGHRTNFKNRTFPICLHKTSY